MGTAFLVCEESGAHSLHKDAILQSFDNETTLTRTLSGKWARGIIRKASAAQNSDEYMSLWSGQSPKLAKKQTVVQLISSIITQVEEMNNLR